MSQTKVGFHKTQSLRLLKFDGVFGTLNKGKISEFCSFKESFEVRGL
ncbi:hypothetical protein [Exiguobacterium artemiae]|nr:hypothetical protein [Exiguobacterium sibiricum]MDW2884365.1 hypothetical protein [Exiguobacterium sibiricum]